VCAVNYGNWRAKVGRKSNPACSWSLLLVGQPFQPLSVSLSKTGCVPVNARAFLRHDSHPALHSWIPDFYLAVAIFHRGPWIGLPLRADVLSLLSPSPRSPRHGSWELAWDQTHLPLSPLGGTRFRSRSQPCHQALIKALIKALSS